MWAVTPHSYRKLRYLSISLDSASNGIISRRLILAIEAYHSYRSKTVVFSCGEACTILENSASNIAVEGAPKLTLARWHGDMFVTILDP
ncbi:MAG: hypothetical protein WAU25_10250 [Nitrososphaeraceae archaeon]